MKELRKKQKKLYRFMKWTVIIGAVFIFVYIGVQPYVAQASDLAAKICGIVSDCVVVAVMVLVFLYYSKYGKADSFLTSAENEINDNGYYISSREETDPQAFLEAVTEDLSKCGYSVNRKVSSGDFEFDIKAVKSKEYFYGVCVDDLDGNDVVAYLDSVITDLTINSIKRKGNAVLLLITDKAQNSAIELSKMITPIGRKEQLKIALAIQEVSSKNTYFLGNVQTKCQQMIANFVMNCDVPIKDKYIHREKLPFQYGLEKKMEKFNLNDFKSGKFFIH